MKKRLESTNENYDVWINDLKLRYRAMQMKSAIAVNSALIEFYWNLGKDICEKYKELTKTEIYGCKFFNKLSLDLKRLIPESTGLSPRNIRYCRYFYELYANSKNIKNLVRELVVVPWGHHIQIMEKCNGDRDKAMFYVRHTIQNGWSRNVLLNWLSTDLYEREGKGQTNFSITMPSDDCDLARQLVKDPQIIEVFDLKKEHNEKELKQAIVANIEKTLLSLGRLVSFVGREYPVELGGETKNIDLLFYIIPLHRYLVIEVKTTKYEPADLGQLSGYMVMAEQVLNTAGDEQPIGLLLCKEHNRVLAKFHLEKLGLPMGITDYELKKILPTQKQLVKCYTDAEEQIRAQRKAAKNAEKSKME